MKKYIVEIKETLSKVIEVNAISKYDALEKVHVEYNNENVILSADDFESSEIRILQSVKEVL